MVQNSLFPKIKNNVFKLHLRKPEYFGAYKTFAFVPVCDQICEEYVQNINKQKNIPVYLIPDLDS